LSVLGGNTYANGINDKGQIVGWYQEGSGGNSVSGFLCSNGVYTTVNVPSATDTRALDINNHGEIVGYFHEVVNNQGEDHGFIFSHGVLSILDDPLAYQGGSTYATGINDKGQVVGYYQNETGIHGFLFDHGTYTTIDNALTDPIGDTFADSNFSSDINDRGQITGWFQDKDGNHGFLGSPVHSTIVDVHEAPVAIQAVRADHNEVTVLGV
jgi:probable HAF family extracellular repeat protein